MVNIVGDHATYHLQFDAPLTSDLDGLGERFLQNLLSGQAEQ